MLLFKIYYKILQVNQKLNIKKKILINNNKLIQLKIQKHYFKNKGILN